MLVRSPGALCDACGVLVEGDPDDLLTNFGWTEDEFGSSFCGKCSEASSTLEQATADDAAIDLLGEAIEEDPAVKALGPLAGQFRVIKGPKAKQ